MQLEFNPARALIALALIALLIPASALAGEMTASWKNGLKLSDDDGNSVKIGGRIYVDWAWFSADDNFKDSARFVPIDGTEFRTARLFAEGTMHGHMFYKFQVDLSSSTNSFKDVYFGFSKTPLFGMDLLIGQFKQPIGLEELTSSKYITFMERSQTAGFAPSRQSGFQLSRPFLDERMTFRGSFYRNTGRRGTGLGNGKYAGAGRLTGVVWKGEDANLVHLGVGVNGSNPLLDLDLAALEPESGLHPVFNVISVPSDFTMQYNFEGAAVMGPFSVQGEFLLLSNSAPEAEPGETLSDSMFSSWYGQASWFLTGESRPYKASRAVFDRVKPKRNYDRSGGKGAFEVAARYSSTDLNDDPYEGGTLDAITLGANWYLNPNTRLMFNWVRSDGKSPEPVDADEQSATGVTNTFQTRFQIDF